MTRHYIQRRSFLTLLGGAAAAWPLAARAQQRVPVIGYLSGGSSEIFEERLRAFRQGLSEVGYMEGRNIAIEYRWSGDRFDHLPAMAADLVSRGVSVIAADGPAIPPAKAASATIPIVFWTAVDPVASGFVTSLNRPSGNLTGVTSMGAEVGPKRLELLRELIPKASNVSLLVNPTNPLANDLSKDMQAAARILGLQLHVLHASTERDFDTVFASLPRLRADGLVISPDQFLVSRTEQLAALALSHAVPAIYQYRKFAAAGGLTSYGGSTDSFRAVGNYVGRILRGEKAADLPVQQATRVELIINMKTAKALGLTFPTAILVRADEVIE
jgi:putative ABC transport system substrate-binding protein